MKSFINASILLVSIFYCQWGAAQDFQLKSKLENIQIQADSSFVNEISIQFKSNKQTRFYPIIYDTELEQISNIQLFEQKGRRLKSLPIKNIEEEAVKLDYINSKKIKIVTIPADKEVQLTYTVICEELMYFSNLDFFSYNQIDTLNYIIDVPNEFKFVHNTIYQDSISFFAMDSISTNAGSKWKIKVAPKKVAPDPLQMFGIYKNMNVPFMRTLVMPSSYSDRPINYMNDWYLNKISSKKGLNSSVKKKIDALTATVTEPSEIVEILYNYVKNNFKYVAIEIGMGAFIPSHANDVYLNKEGDCKDLSNFLSEALKYKGIESDIALAATFQHISDCDFPSLSSANHVICIAYINNETILLDPTDPVHLMRTPVQSLQDRTILIVNKTGGSFYKINAFSAQQNEISYNLNLNLDANENVIKGTFEIDYAGLSSNYLRRMQKYDGEEKFALNAETYYKEIFGNQTISDLSLINTADTFQLTGNIVINGKTFNDASHRYLFIDFLPRLIETESREALIEGTYLNNPYQKKVVVRIKLDEPIEAFNPIEHSKIGEGVSLHLNVRAISNTEIECHYNFIIDHLFIDRENSNTTNEILESFKNIINAPIVLETQKS
ncbi:transglutaminase-like domain-containing protein [Aequorivita flava]|uniref:Transglutaminase-like domain-containing protein n=1 Tax=Aequorivita flava TaxID=3114371 RepID=A0AB35YRE5_9FLAO